MAMARLINMDGQWFELTMVLVKVDSTRLLATWERSMSTRIQRVDG